MAGPVGCAYFLIFECTFFCSEWTRYNFFGPLPILKIVCVILDIQCSVGAAISLILHSFSILTRVCFGHQYFKDIFGLFPTLVIWNYGGKNILDLECFMSRNSCGWTFCLGFIVGAVISLTFDCFWILTRVYENQFLTFFYFFFTWICIIHWK